MRNFFQSALYLTVFAIGGIVFQISCSNSDFDDNNINNINSTQVGKIVYETGDAIWTANYDGTNATQIAITLPANVNFNFGSVSSSLSISPDGSKVFFTCSNTTYTYLVTELYSCDVIGGNAVQVIASPSGGSNNDHIGHSIAY